MTKEELLSFLAEVEDVTATEVADKFDLPYFTAGMALLRLTRQSLVERYLDTSKNCFWYRLTERGTERLNYLESKT